MFKSILLSGGIMIGLSVLWVCVQSGWRKMFVGRAGEQDVLARRGKCGGCGCSTVCHNELKGNDDQGTARSGNLQ